MCTVLLYAAQSFCLEPVRDERREANEKKRTKKNRFVSYVSATIRAQPILGLPTRTRNRQWELNHLLFLLHIRAHTVHTANVANFLFLFAK